MGLNTEMSLSQHRLRPGLALALLAGVLWAGCGQEQAAPVDDGSAADAVANGADGQIAGDGVEVCGPHKRAAAPSSLDALRPAKVYLPEAWDGCSKWPLIVLLHGYTASGALQNFYLGLSKRVNSHGFVLLVPEGTKSLSGKLFWNATNACCDFDGQNIDDVGYLRGLITAATASLAVDPERVYLIGHSNGGFMGYRMACEAADLVAGVASIAGAVTATEADCAPTRPVNVLQIHGTKDATVPYGGTKYYPAATAALERWAGLNGCQAAPELPNVDYDLSVDGPETSREHRGGGKEGTQADLWTMTGSSHIPGFNDGFKDAMVETVLAWRRTPAP